MNSRLKLALACALLIPAPVMAQGTLRVLRHTPVDSSTPGGIVTVTFDRPVVGMAGATADPTRILQISPRVRGSVHWRDPITLRFIPDEPVAPGTRVDVLVDTGFATPSGARLHEPFRFSFVVPGPRPIGRFPRTQSIAPNQLFSVLYSAPVDSAAAARDAAIQFDGKCGNRRVPLPVVRQRKVEVRDPYEYREAGSHLPDSVRRRFFTVVEFRADSLLPGGCVGDWHVPSFGGPSDSSWSYVVEVQPEPEIVEVSCVAPCGHTAITVRFSAPVSGGEVTRHLSFSPSLQPPADTAGARTDWTFTGTIAPRTAYRMTVDSQFRDAYGRELTGQRDRRFYSGDLEPVISHPTGFRILHRSAPTVRVSGINVSRIRVLAISIPDRLRGRILSPPGHLRSVQLDGARDTTVIVVDVPARPNVSIVVTVPLDRLVPAGRPVELRFIADSLLGLPPDPRDVSIPLLPRPERVLDDWERQSLPSARSLAARLNMLVIQRSDLAVHSRIAADSGAVFVTSLLDGSPVASARVTLRDAYGVAVSTGETDARGLATLSRAGLSPGRYDNGYTELVTSRDGDTVVSPLVSPAFELDEHPSPNALGATFTGPTEGVARILTDRALYRPGEVLYAKVVARDGWLGQLRAIAGDSLRWRYDRRDGTSLTHTTALTSFGSGTDSVAIPAEAEPGYMHMSVERRRNGVWVALAQAYVQVAEYRPAQFRLVAAVADSFAVAGDSVTVNAVAQYLFGQPMAGAAVNWNARTFAFPDARPRTGLDGFIVGSTVWWDRPGGMSSYHPGAAMAGSDGQLRFVVPTRPSTSPMRLSVFMTVQDESNQYASTVATATIHAADLYVGARPQTAAWRSGVPGTIVIAATDARGARLRKTVRVTLGRMRTVFDEDRGTQLVFDTVSRSTAAIDTTGTTVTVTPVNGGWHEIRLEGEDDSGRPAVTRFPIYVAGNPPSSLPSGTVRIPVTVDTRFAAVGDSVTVRFDSPFSSANAWLTVEREGVIDQRVIVARAGDNVARIRVDRRHLPGVWVGVTLVPAGARASGDSAPLFTRTRAGYAELIVDTSIARIPVTITAPAVAAPGDTTAVEVSLRGLQGRRAEVAVWAVDEGVLALAGLRELDLLPVVYARRGVGVRFRTSLAGIDWARTWATDWVQLRSMSTSADSFALARVTAPISGQKAPFAVSDVDLRERFRSTAFFVGHALTDSNGVARIREALPDNLTEFRLIAIAVTDDDRYGFAERPLVVTKPLVVRAAIPRFVRQGDSLDIVALGNLRGVAPRVDFAASATGARLTSDSSATVEGSERTVSARFPIAVPADSIGPELAVAVAGRSTLGDDGLRVTVPIRPTSAPRHHARSAYVTGNSMLSIDLPDDIDPARTKVTIRVGGSPLPAVLSSLPFLRQYSNYSTESAVSYARAMLAALYLSRAGGAADTSVQESEVVALLRSTADLIRRRTTDGIVASWEGEPESARSLWPTIEAIDFLLESSRLVPEFSTRARALAGSLVSRRRYGPKLDTVHGSPAERLDRRQAWHATTGAIALAARRAGADTSLEAEALAAASVVRWEDRIVLAELLRARGAVPTARALLDTLWSGLRNVGARIDFPDSLRRAGGFPSHIRPAARLFRATLKLRPDHPRLAALERTMIAQAGAERALAWNTQDYAWAAVAMADRVSSMTGVTPTVTIGFPRGPSIPVRETRVVERPLTDFLVESVGGADRATVRLSVDGGPAYVAVSVAEVPRSRPVTPDISGFVVERWYERVSDGVAVTAVPEGELVRVSLRVTVPADRQFVVVEDLLPAGLEVVDRSLRSTGVEALASTSVAREMLRTHDSGGQFMQSLLYGSWWGGAWSPWESRAIRDDRVVFSTRLLWAGSYVTSYLARATTAGVFVRPPAYAIELYDPAVQGRSDGGSFVVTRKP